MEFGAYLLKKWKINGSELANALKSQPGDFVVFGDMAINADILTKEQVTSIMDLQRKQGGVFVLDWGILMNDPKWFFTFVMDL